MNAADAPHQVQPLHIIGGKVDHMTNRDLTDGHLTQSQDLQDREVVNSAWPAVSQKGPHSLLLPPFFFSLLPPPSITLLLPFPLVFPSSVPPPSFLTFSPSLPPSLPLSLPPSLPPSLLVGATSHQAPTFWYMAAVAAILASIPMFFPMRKAWPWATITSSANSTRPKGKYNLFTKWLRTSLIPRTSLSITGLTQPITP